MLIGVTGTRYGLTDEQATALVRLLTTQFAGVTVLRHGACKGADAQVVKLVRQFRGTECKIVAHPGKSARASDAENIEWLDNEALKLSDEVLESKTHFARNRDIVAQSSIVIGLPGTSNWLTHGGTFYTMDHCIKQGKPLHVIWPDGNIEVGTAR